MATTRPRTPAKSPPETLPSITENGNPPPAQPNPRRTSLGFLRRSKSTEPVGGKSGRVSKKMLKEQAKEELRRKQANAIPRHAPRLPDLSPTPLLKTFGGDDRPDSVAIMSNRLDSRTSSSHEVPSGTTSPSLKENYDPYARAESMTHRGRYSYASSAVSAVNSPRRLRRRKDPTPYNVLVIGARNSGKTAFLEFLRKSLALPPNKHPTRSPEELEEQSTSPADRNFTSHYLETEIDGERVGLTLWDSEGLERNMVDLQLREITGFLESKFEDTFTEEMKVVRSPGVRDTHIHCTFLILDPVRLDANIAAAERAKNGKARPSDPSRVVGVLDEDLDLQVLRTMLGKTTVVPVISKADTVTTVHMTYLKKAVWDSLKEANIDPLEVLTLEDQDDYSSSESVDKIDENEEDEAEAEAGDEAEDKSTADKDAAPAATPDSETLPSNEKNQEQGSPSRNSQGTRKSSSSTTESPHLPLSILSPDPHSLEAGNGPVGRQYPWGFADPYNPEHCDFVKLKEAVFSEWRSELREASREIWYEGWRTSRLNRNTNGNGVNWNGRTGPGPAKGGRSTR